MRLGALSLFLATVAACGGAFTTPGNDGGIGGGAGNGGQAGTFGGGGGDLGGGPSTGGFAGDLGGYPMTGGFAGDLGGSAGAGGGRAGAGGSGGSAGRPGTGGSTGAAGDVDSGLDFGVCSGPGQCILMPVSCCGVCGQPTASDFVAINSSNSAAYQKHQCPVALPCPACATTANPNLGARCVQSHCQVFDVQKVSEYSSCQAPSDCVLRNGAGCCECGGNGWISVSQSGNAALRRDECAPNGACLTCAPVPPTGAVPVCVGGVCGMASAALL
jgi:hypothetical protein